MGATHPLGLQLRTSHGVLQRVAACCSVLQKGFFRIVSVLLAACCSVLQKGFFHIVNDASVIATHALGPELFVGHSVSQTKVSFRVLQHVAVGVIVYCRMASLTLTETPACACDSPSGATATRKAQHVAACCGVLMCVALCCRQIIVAVNCMVLQAVLPYVALYGILWQTELCDVVQDVARVARNVLHRDLVCCSVLQCVAVT